MPLSCKNAYPPPFFCIPVWSSRRPLRSRRMDDLCYPDPPHRSFSNRIHSLLSTCSQFSTSFIIWLATFVSIVLRLASVCISSHHTYATLPTPHPFKPSHWRSIGVRPFGQRLADAVGQFCVIHPFATDKRCALCPYHSSLFRLSCRQTIIDPISPFCNLVV